MTEGGIGMAKSRNGTGSPRQTLRSTRKSALSPPPTLRYYEEIGLLPPAERTPAGYRLYDDRAIERLTFIARAKELGCTLEEITDLAEPAHSAQCAPIKHRLRAVVAAKLATTEARIAELAALASELRSTA